VTSHAPLKKISEKSKNKRLVPQIIIVVLVFLLGLNIGNGRLAANTSDEISRDLPDNLDYSSVEAIYDQLRTSYDGELNQQELLDGLKQGLATASGDPYTEYFNASDAEEFDDELNGSFTGIGAELGKRPDGGIEIISPIAGFPAEKAGLKAKDLIAEVDGTSTIGLTVTEAVSKIRGEANTKVKLKIIRNNAEELDFEITRAQITVASVKSEIIEGNIGLLTISRFGPDTVQLAREAAQSFKQANVKGVILDVRGDPGGLLDAAVGVSSLWLDKSQTVLQEKRDGRVVKTFKATSSNPPLKGVKTVVLINEGSASASEITAGALRDNKAATLLGTKSYGKGSVQQLIELSDGGMLKVTSAHWYTPSGKGIDKSGLEPDQKVERSDDDLKNNRDPQKDAAIAEIKK
jgi:carboxyl-terminal processing protease